MGDRRNDARLRAIWALSACALLLLAAACGGGGRAPEGGQDRREQAQEEQGERDRGEATRTAAGDPENGRRLYAATCATCHGQNGQGIAGLGKDLTESRFVRESSDEELVEFLRVGRPANHPENTTGIAMPPRGGNPSLTDQDLADIAAYLRELQK